MSDYQDTGPSPAQLSRSGNADRRRRLILSTFRVGSLSFYGQHGDDALIATINGHLNGENDQDRTFHGVSIAFESLVTSDRVADRTGYSNPSFARTGEVDNSRYCDD